MDSYLERAGGSLSRTEPCEGSDRGGPCRSRSSEGLPSLDLSGKQATFPEKPVFGHFSRTQQYI